MAEISFGEWLKRQRKALGLTQEQLASQINCSTSALRKFEAEERHPSVQLAELLAGLFSIPTSERSKFLKFVRGDWKSGPNQAVEETPWNLTSPRSNMPAPVTSFIGRGQEIADIYEYLLKENIRLVTLVGPPGIGKTRLSLQAAQKMLAHFPSGVFFVQLAPVDDPALVGTVILQTLGYSETSKNSAVDEIVSDIGNKKMLLVLDNFEHLINEAAPLASRLLSGCPQLKILVTSREALRVPGEWLYPVPTLLTPKENSFIDIQSAPDYPALTLFSERARAARPDFTLEEDNIQTVTSICAHLDGLPLAIELISARIRLMSPKELLDRLNYRFILSADGMRATPGRQKTLQNAISWSYNLLSPEEQKLFVYLSVFAGGFNLTSAESIFSHRFENKSVPELIGSLLDKSLLQRSTDKLGDIRYDMLVTIQQFALNCLHDLGEETNVCNDHMAYFIGLAENSEKEVHGPDQIVWMDRLNDDLDNFRAAIQWGLFSNQTSSTLRLFAALAWTWNVRWSQAEARRLFNKIRALPDVNRFPENFARILNSAGLREWRLTNNTEAQSILDESLAIWLKLGMNGELGQAEALNRLGLLANLWDSDHKKAETYFNESLMLYQKHEDPWGVAWNLFHLGGLAIQQNQPKAALSFLTQSWELYSDMGDPWGIARVSQFMGTLYLLQGDYKKAYLYFDQHLKNDEKNSFMDGVSVALFNFGELYRLTGDNEQAAKYYEKSLAMCLEYGYKPVSMPFTSLKPVEKPGE